MIVRILLFALATTALAAAFFICLYVFEKKESRKIRSELCKEQTEKAKADARIASLELTLEIQARHRRNTDEKISDLHDGDSVLNALSELSEHGHSDGGDSRSS